MIEGISFNIAWYFFLAGAGSGAFMVNVLVEALVEETRPRMFATLPHQSPALVPLACVALVVAGALFLLADLGVPGLFFLVLRGLGRSVISFGALSLGLFAALGCAYAAALGLGVPRGSRALAALKWAAFAAALAVAGYTGYYLFAMGTVGLWSTPLLVLLFVASALSTGCAVLALLAFCRHPALRAGRLRALRGADVVSLGLEAAVLAAFVASRLLAGGDAAAMAFEMVVGGHAWVFWLGAVTLGLAVPAGASVLAARGGETYALVGAFATLLGGFALRCSVLLA